MWVASTSLRVGANRVTVQGTTRDVDVRVRRAFAAYVEGARPGRDGDSARPGRESASAAAGHTYGVVLPEDAPEPGRARRLGLLYEDGILVARTRDPEEMMRALSARLARWSESPAGRLPVPGAVLVRSGHAVVGPDAFRTSTAMTRRLAPHGITIAPDAVAWVDPREVTVLSGTALDAADVRTHAIAGWMLPPGAQEPPDVAQAVWGLTPVRELPPEDVEGALRTMAHVLQAVPVVNVPDGTAAEVAQAVVALFDAATDSRR